METEKTFDIEKFFILTKTEVTTLTFADRLVQLCGQIILHDGLLVVKDTCCCKATDDKDFRHVITSNIVSVEGIGMDPEGALYLVYGSDELTDTTAYNFYTALRLFYRR